MNVKGSRVVRVQHADGTYVDSKPGSIQGPSWTADGKYVVYSKHLEQWSAPPLQRVWRALSDSTEFGTWFGMKFDSPFSQAPSSAESSYPPQSMPR